MYPIIRTEPVLVINVKKMRARSSRLCLKAPSFEVLDVHVDWGWETIHEYHDLYHHSLEAFKDELNDDSLEQELSRLSLAFRNLFRGGKNLFGKFFGSQTTFILNYLRRVIAKKGNGLQPLGVIEIITKDFANVFPIEGLVLTGSNPEVKNQKDLIEAASGIIGFSFIVKRVIRKFPFSEKRHLNNDPSLPIKYFCGTDLKHVKDELEFFVRNKKNIYLDGPWPNTAEQFKEGDFIKYLYDPYSTFREVFEPGDLDNIIMDEIHHLSCHCGTEKLASGDHWLSLSDKEVAIIDIENALAEFKDALQIRRERESQPLVFFNACGSSKILPHGMTSFPEFFLKQIGSCGFIGSEIRIPDLFASYFTKLFYQYLIIGYGVGEAVFMARRKMLIQHQNPLGILYKIYGDPYLRVSNPIKTWIN